MDFQAAFYSNDALILIHIMVVYTCAGDNTYMVASTVSSKILQAIGKKEGFHFEVSIYNIIIPA